MIQNTIFSVALTWTFCLQPTIRERLSAAHFAYNCLQQSRRSLPRHKLELLRQHRCSKPDDRKAGYKQVLDPLFADEKKGCSCCRLRSTFTRLSLTCSVLRRDLTKPLDSGLENPLLRQDQQLVYTKRKLKRSVFQVSPGCLLCEFSQLFSNYTYP